MIFRYDFGSNLDLSKFKKQFKHYLEKITNIDYHLFFNEYKLIIEIKKIDESMLDQINQLSQSEKFCKPLPNNLHMTSISIYDLTRDQDGEIIKSDFIIPLNDIRFKELKQIVEIFPFDHYKGFFNSFCFENTTDKISKIINILLKINKLKLFF